MKKLISISLVLSVLLITSSCTKDDDFFGSSNITSEIRNVATFNKVSSEGIFTVNIFQGPVQSLEVITNANIIHRLKTKVSNNKLEIYLSDGNYDNIVVELNITVPNLNEIHNSGTGEIVVTELISSDNMKIVNSGTGSIRISGSVNSLDIKNEGSGAIHCSQFMSTDTEVKIIGSGNCEVNCTGILNINIKGSGDVHYIGHPTINADISGSGEIIDAN